MVAALASSCGTATICPKPEALTGADGGATRCLVSVDCPRQSNLLVCSSTLDHFSGCIDCLATECVRYRPGPCP